MFTSRVLATILSTLSIANAARITHKQSDYQCKPFHTKFPAGSVSPSSRDFVSLGPERTYRAGGNGLELLLDRPEGRIKTKDQVNDKLSDGATINGTSTFMYGKVTGEISCPQVPGIVCAMILVAEDGRGEIDIEILGGDTSHFQTNVFAPSPEDEDPHYGVFSSVEDLPGDSDSKRGKSSHGSIEEFHAYSIEWNEERIVWSVDGAAVRSLRAKDTFLEDIPHYPVNPMHVQVGIWDASSPEGTSAWAKGPIRWDKSPSRMRAVVRSMSLEC